MIEAVKFFLVLVLIYLVAEFVIWLVITARSKCKTQKQIEEIEAMSENEIKEFLKKSDPEYYEELYGKD